MDEIAASFIRAFRADPSTKIENPYDRSGRPIQVAEVFFSNLTSDEEGAELIRLLARLADGPKDETPGQFLAEVILRASSLIAMQARAYQDCFEDTVPIRRPAWSFETFRDSGADAHEALCR